MVFFNFIFVHLFVDLFIFSFKSIDQLTFFFFVSFIFLEDFQFALFNGNIFFILKIDQQKENIASFVFS